MSAQPLEPAAAVSLIEDAVTAPSMHNAQPWRFVFRPSSGTVELYGDSTRAMPHSDPNHRALHLGCAAALFNLRVAAVHAGREPVVRLLPDPHDPWFLAEVHLRGTTADPEARLALFHPALRRRHTSRFPFTDEEIPAPILDGLRAVALLEECKLMLPDAWHTEAVLDLVHDSENREGSSPAVREETASWTRTGAPGEGPATEGIPAYAFGPRQSGMSAPVRDFGSWRPAVARDSAVFEKHPHIALLGTSGDTPTDWMKSKPGPAAHPAPGHPGRPRHLDDLPAPGVARTALGGPRPERRDGPRPHGHPPRLRPPGSGDAPAARAGRAHGCVNPVSGVQRDAAGRVRPINGPEPAARAAGARGAKILAPIIGPGPISTASDRSAPRPTTRGHARVASGAPEACGGVPLNVVAPHAAAGSCLAVRADDSASN